jgi:uncharacterized membrane protein
MRYAEDFRRIAREALKGRWALAIGTGIVAGILGANGGGGGGGGSSRNLNYQDSLDFEALRFMLPIIIGIFSIVMLFALIQFFFGGAVKLGYCRFNKNLLDDTNPQLKDLFSRFDIFWKGFLMQLLIAIYTLLWTLLLIIPGIIAAFSYAMTPYILEEHPEMGVNEAIQASKEMMRGNKWRLFCLGFSFIGWGILCLFTCGLGFLVLSPYIYASYAAFYYDVSGKYTAENDFNGINNDQPMQY